MVSNLHRLRALADSYATPSHPKLAAETGLSDGVMLARLLHDEGSDIKGLAYGDQL